jgi:glycine cleavage system H protein
METVRFRHAHFSARFPVDCLYTPSHFWMRPADGAAGRAVEMVLDVKPGQTVAGGERLGTVEGFKAVSDLFCVVDGTLSATNPALTAEACLTHSDPYGAGWLYAVDGTPTLGYLDVHGYIALLTATIDQLQASRYSNGEDSDGDGHAASEPAASAESEQGDTA